MAQCCAPHRSRGLPLGSSTSRRARQGWRFPAGGRLVPLRQCLPSGPQGGLRRQPPRRLPTTPHKAVALAAQEVNECPGDGFQLRQPVQGFAISWVHRLGTSGAHTSGHPSWPALPRPTPPQGCCSTPASGHPAAMQGRINGMNHCLRRVKGPAASAQAEQCWECSFGEGLPEHAGLTSAPPPIVNLGQGSVPGSGQSRRWPVQRRHAGRERGWQLGRGSKPRKRLAMPEPHRVSFARQPPGCTPASSSRP